MNPKPLTPAEWDARIDALASRSAAYTHEMARFDSAMTMVKLLLLGAVAVAVGCFSGRSAGELSLAIIVSAAVAWLVHRIVAEVLAARALNRIDRDFPKPEPRE